MEELYHAVKKVAKIEIKHWKKKFKSYININN